MQHGMDASCKIQHLYSHVTLGHRQTRQNNLSINVLVHNAFLVTRLYARPQTIDSIKHNEETTVQSSIPYIQSLQLHPFLI